MNLLLAEDTASVGAVELGMGGMTEDGEIVVINGEADDLVGGL